MFDPNPNTPFEPGPLEAYLTFNDLVAKSGLVFHRVRYILRSRGIKPVAKLGPVYLYSPEALAMIKLTAQQLEEGWNGRPNMM